MTFREQSVWIAWRVECLYGVPGLLRAWLMESMACRVPVWSTGVVKGVAYGEHGV